jgi:hypothetical protein
MSSPDENNGIRANGMNMQFNGFSVTNLGGQMDPSVMMYLMKQQQQLYELELKLKMGDTGSGGLGAEIQTAVEEGSKKKKKGRDGVSGLKQQAERIDYRLSNNAQVQEQLREYVRAGKKALLRLYVKHCGGEEAQMEKAEVKAAAVFNIIPAEAIESDEEFGQFTIWSKQVIQRWWSQVRLPQLPPASF